MHFPITRLAPLVLLFTFTASFATSADAAEKASSPPAAPADKSDDNPELAHLYQEDQADRRPSEGKQIDWTVVSPRDDARLARVKALYGAGQLKTGADYYHAAMILQHGDGPEDYLLAHELCVVALSKGYQRALWLAAASEDRFLRKIGRPQRFGTQYLSEGDGPMRLQETDESVTDEHRRAMKVPPIAEAKARASRLGGAQGFNDRPATDAPPLAQTLFTVDDTAEVAIAKLRSARPKTAAEALSLILACRDFCLRFPQSFYYGEARILAASYWTRLDAEQIASLGGWSAPDGETDPKLNPDQRADVAVRLAYGRAAQKANDGTIPFAETQFDEVLAINESHRGTRAAREALIHAALHVDPAKGISALRTLYPENADAAAAVRQLEKIGRPLELSSTTVNGDKLELTAYRGKVVLIHFFAKRFPSSADLVPQLRELVARHGAANLALIGINTDSATANAHALIQQHAISWPVLHEPSNRPESLVARFRATTLPYYFLVDRRGNLRHRGV